MKKNIGAKIFFFPPWDAKLTKAMESPLLGLWDGDRPSDLWNGLSIIFPGWDSSFSEVISQIRVNSHSVQRIAVGATGKKHT